MSSLLINRALDIFQSLKCQTFGNKKFKFSLKISYFDLFFFVFLTLCVVKVSFDFMGLYPDKKIYCQLSFLLVYIKSFIVQHWEHS